MKLTQVVLRGFRGFHNLEYRPATGLSVLVAMNGTGKTSAIEGLGVSLSSLCSAVADESAKGLPAGLIVESDHSRQWLDDPRLPPTVEKMLSIEGAAKWGDLSLAWKATSYRTFSSGVSANDSRLAWVQGKKEFLEKLRAAAGGSEPLPLFAALRSHRSLRGDKTRLPEVGVSGSKPSERLLRLAADIWLDLPWYRLRDEWFELEKRRDFVGDRASAALQSIVVALTRALRLRVPPQFNADAEDFLIELPDGEGWRSVGLMSDGWRSYVGSVVALAMRCAEVNPLQADAAATTPGILLVDEIEQHLHPELQLRVVDGLRRAFPLFQIIATTHSPLVLTDVKAAESDRVWRLDRGTDGVVSLAPLLAPVGRNAEQVLTGSWFGVSSTLDDETLRMMAEHRKLLRDGDGAKNARTRLEEELRRRLGRYAETSVEVLVLAVVAELERDVAFESLSHAEVLSLRERVVSRIRAELR